MSTICLPTLLDPRLLPQGHASVVLAEHEKKEKLETDAMFRLEHGEADRSTLKKALPTLSHIQEAQNAWKDDFALNSMLRRHFRVREAPQGNSSRLRPVSPHPTCKLVISCLTPCSLCAAQESCSA